MLTEEDKKALNELGKRWFFWKGKIKRYSQVAGELDLESLDKEIKQYDDIRWFSKFFFKKLGLFLFGSISKKRKLLCYLALSKYLNDTNNTSEVFGKNYALLVYQVSKLSVFSSFLKRLINRILAMKEKYNTQPEDKSIEPKTVKENLPEKNITEEENIEDLDVRENSREDSVRINNPDFITSNLLNAVPTKVKEEIINFGHFLVESEYRMQALQEETEENKQEINILKDSVIIENEERKKEKEESDKKIQEAKEESDKKIELLEKALKEEQERRQKEKEEADKKIKEEEEKRKKEKEESTKEIAELKNSVGELTNLVKLFMANNSNNAQSSSNPLANNGPGFFK